MFIFIYAKYVYFDLFFGLNIWNNCECTAAQVPEVITNPVLLLKTQSFKQKK